MRHLLIIFLCAFLSMGAASRFFDGTDDEISMGAVLNAGTGDFSICSHVQTTEDGSRDHIAGNKNSDSAAAAGYRLYQTSTDLITCQVSDGADQRQSLGGDYDGVWVFACCTWNSSEEITRMVVNGIEEDTDTWAGDVGSLSTTSNFQIGESHADDDDAAARIAYVNRYGRVLNDLEINELMWKPDQIVEENAGQTGFWLLLADNPEPDLSGNGNPGTVSGTDTGSIDGPKTVMFGGGLPL